MTRARALIVQDAKIVLIERRRGNHRYDVFPGGGVEPNELPAQAVAREILEELGLEVEVGDLVAEIVFDGEPQLFFRATVVGGELGTGAGPEATGRAGPEQGSYTPVWVPVDEVSRRPVLPACVARMVVAAITDGWPPEARGFGHG